MSNYKDEDRLEAHYTPQFLIEELKLLKELITFEITEYLETSAGDGRLIDELFDKPYLAYDIDNRKERKDIKTCNYLKEVIPYKQGRVCIMNPPFTIGIKFLTKALKECDYVIAIMSKNSLINIDYDSLILDEIQLWRKVDFVTCNVDMIIVACRRKIND